MEKFTQFKLDEHIIIGNVLKILRSELMLSRDDLIQIYSKSNSFVKQLEKTINKLDDVKCFMNKILQHDYPSLNDDCSSIYCGKYPYEFPEDLSKLKQVITRPDV